MQITPFDVTEEMLTRFLSWKLPSDFMPDAGITFKRVYNETSPYGPSVHEPTGTNLFTAVQARAMLEHVLSSRATEPAPVAWRWDRSDGTSGYYDQDPASFDIDMSDKRWKWTPLYASRARSAQLAPLQRTEP